MKYKGNFKNDINCIIGNRLEYKNKELCIESLKKLIKEIENDLNYKLDTHEMVNSLSRIHITLEILKQIYRVSDEQMEYENKINIKKLKEL